MIAIGNNSRSVEMKKNNLCENIEGMIEDMIDIAYELLWKSQGTCFYQLLVNKYATIILDATQSRQLIYKTYQKLADLLHFKVCL